MQVLVAAANEAAAEVEAKSRSCVARRKPLVRHTVAQQPAIKQYTPRFEEDFARNKDYDPDRYAHPNIPKEERVRERVCACVCLAPNDGMVSGLVKTSEFELLEVDMSCLLVLYGELCT